MREGNYVRVLIAGGTSFVGHAIAQTAHEAGHEVTLINRGRTLHDLPAGVERLVGDRQGDLSALAGRSFDATIDTIAYRPRDVSSLAGALAGRGGRHVQISSISAYRPPTTAGATEEQCELWDEEDLDPEGPITGTTYGPLKAACERAAHRAFGTDTLFVRPTYVIGARDVTFRLPYWVVRATSGGAVAVPGPRANALQYVDARDLASFTVAQLDAGTTGAVHVAGPHPAPGYVESIERIVAHAGPPGARVVELDAQRVVAAGAADKFPLWGGPEDSTLMRLDSARAFGLGLRLRPLEESVDDVAAWWATQHAPAWWLESASERRLLEEG